MPPTTMPTIAPTPRCFSSATSSPSAAGRSGFMPSAAVGAVSSAVSFILIFVPLIFTFGAAIFEVLPDPIFERKRLKSPSRDW